MNRILRFPIELAMTRSLIGFLLLISLGCSSQLEKDFVHPPDEFKPMPLWHINGDLTTEGIQKQMRDAKELAGFTGVSILPMASYGKKIGTTPRFLSEDYFERYQDILNIARELDMEVILYDDNDFPSGMAGGKMESLYPELCRKRLDKVELEISGPEHLSDQVPGGTIMSAVAMNTDSHELIDLRSYIRDRTIDWRVPPGDWKVMYFVLVTEGSHKKYLITDILDTVAVRKMIELTYDVYYNRFGSYFGNTIKKTFFDDVGFWRFPRTWTGRFNDKFRELNGFDPEPYYPALWYNIGPDTESIRYAFFLTRAELLAEGFPKLVADWAKRHRVKDTGHPPGNYDPTPIDMNGDIFKFFRYTAIPLTDAIIHYQFGQDGHKLISSAADYYDRSMVATEIYGAYKEASFDSLMLYRAIMDMFIRGVNVVIPHGMWYDSDRVYIQPLVSPESEKIATALPAYSEFVGRSSMMLRGGRRISEIGLLYPFESLAGWYRFEDPENPRQGFFVSPETDYLQISGILTNEVRRDFTFVHPEFLLDEKYGIEKGLLKLKNAENFQTYRTMIIPGCNIISYKALEKLKAFYDNGGLIISTTQLPFKAAEIGEDTRVCQMVKAVFGIDPLSQHQVEEIKENANPLGGVALFVPHPSAVNLGDILAKYAPVTDVQFIPNPAIAGDFGKFSYIHKIKDGKDIYYFANSSNEMIDTEVLLRGNLKIEKWDPHTGETLKPATQIALTDEDQNLTRVQLKLPPVHSVFLVGK